MLSSEITRQREARNTATVLVESWSVSCRLRYVMLPVWTFTTYDRGICMPRWNLFGTATNHNNMLAFVNAQCNSIMA